MPFYKTLLGLPGMDGVAARVIILTRGGAAPAMMALKGDGIKAHSISSYPEDAADLPTALGSVFILDKTGAVLKRWDKFPTPAQQEEVIAPVKGLLR